MYIVSYIQFKTRFVAHDRFEIDWLHSSLLTAVAWYPGYNLLNSRISINS